MEAAQLEKPLMALMAMMARVSKMSIMKTAKNSNLGNPIEHLITITATRLMTARA